MEMTFGKGISTDGLDAKTRLLLTLAGLTMQGAQNETGLRMTVRHALEAGGHRRRNRRDHRTDVDVCRHTRHDQGNGMCP